MPECIHVSYGRDSAMIIAVCLHMVVFHQTNPLNSPLHFQRAEQALRVTLCGHCKPGVQSLALQGQTCLPDHSDFHTLLFNRLG